MKGPFDIRGRIRLGPAVLGSHAAWKAVRDGQYRSVEAILRNLYGRDEPGAVLGDEVGLGKTYVSYGVAAWLLSEDPAARVLVLTNSSGMTGVWAERWGEISWHGTAGKPEAIIARTFAEYRAYAHDRAHRLVISSYDALKRFTYDEVGALAAIARWVLEKENRPDRDGLRKLTSDRRARLLRTLGLDLRRRPAELQRAPSRAEALRFWRTQYDPRCDAWRDPVEAARALRDLEIGCNATEDAALQRPFHLVVVDEAHRLQSQARDAAMRLLIDRRTRKVLYVTATPFALDVRQLVQLFERFSYSDGCDFEALRKRIEGIGLENFQRAVSRAKDKDRAADGLDAATVRRIEGELRRWIVRRAWRNVPGAPQRIEKPCKVPVLGGRQFAAAIAIERAIAELMERGERTHVASRRAGLCSSWRAALASLSTGALVGRVAGPWIKTARRLLVGNAESPKIRAVVRLIARKVEAEEKVVVFSERTETLTALRDLLGIELRQRAEAARANAKQWLGNIRKGKRFSPISSEPEESHRALAHCLAGALPVRRGMAWDRADELASALLSHRMLRLKDVLAGYRRRTPLEPVQVYDGARGDETTLARFNLPGAPWVLLCSKKAQESIDLHRESRTVVLVDPVWNPAHREQRIGRVHRFGSRFDRIEVIDAYTDGTYEQKIFERARERAHMMEVLLGAGYWLDRDREVDVDERFQVNLEPDAPHAVESFGELPEPDCDYVRRHWAELGGRAQRIGLALLALGDGWHLTRAVHKEVLRTGGTDPYLPNVGKELRAMLGVYVEASTRRGVAVWRSTQRLKIVLAGADVPSRRVALRSGVKGRARG